MRDNDYGEVLRERSRRWGASQQKEREAMEKIRDTESRMRTLFVKDGNNYVCQLCNKVLHPPYAENRLHQHARVHIKEGKAILSQSHPFRYLIIGVSKNG